MDPGSIAALHCVVGGITTIFIVIFGITAPVWLLAQYMKHRGARRIGPDEIAILDRISRIADRMDQRMAAVERILDADSPSWRDSGGATGGRYEHTG